MGVLFRNAEAIETLRTVDTLVLDKPHPHPGRPALTQVTALANSPKRSYSPARRDLSARASIFGRAIVDGALARASHRSRSRTSTP